MALTEDQISALDTRAQAVGQQIGWQLRFVVAPNPEYVGLAAGPDQVIIVGPSRLSDLGAHDIDVTLDDLKEGRRRILPNEDGDPRIW